MKHPSAARQPAAGGLGAKAANGFAWEASADDPAYYIEQPPLEPSEPRCCQAQTPEEHAAPQANVPLAIECQGQEPDLQGQQAVGQRPPRRALKVMSRPQAPRQPLLQQKEIVMASKARVGQPGHNPQLQALLSARDEFQPDPYRCVCLPKPLHEMHKGHSRISTLPHW